MYSYVENFSLHKDDIEGIQYLYGKLVLKNHAEFLLKKKICDLLSISFLNNTFCRQQYRP